jgi:transcriptional regulator with XRE-family HTH domain
MTLGEKIRNRRIELNMTMEDLGNAIGVQRSAINKYEKDIVSDLKRSTIQALANALRVSPLYLLEEDDEDQDQQRLEALHQNPRLGLLFDRSRKMSHEDVETMLAVAASILKERDGDD